MILCVYPQYILCCVGVGVGFNIKRGNLGAKQGCMYVGRGGRRGGMSMAVFYDSIVMSFHCTQAAQLFHT